MKELVNLKTVLVVKKDRLNQATTDITPDCGSLIPCIPELQKSILLRYLLQICKISVCSGTTASGDH